MTGFESGTTESLYALCIIMSVDVDNGNENQDVHTLFRYLVLEDA